MIEARNSIRLTRKIFKKFGERKRHSMSLIKGRTKGVWGITFLKSWRTAVGVFLEFISYKLSSMNRKWSYFTHSNIKSVSNLVSKNLPLFQKKTWKMPKKKQHPKYIRIKIFKIWRAHSMSRQPKKYFGSFRFRLQCLLDFVGNLN